jgi:hypothetical protein
MADKPDEQLPLDELQFNSDLFSKILNVDPTAANAVRKLFEYVAGDPILIGMSSSGLLGKMTPEQKIGLLDAKINQDAPISIDERAALGDAFKPIVDSLVKVISDDIERMGSRLFEAGFPDPRKDHGAWRIIAKMVGCDPDGSMEDIFDSAMAYHASKQQADRIDDGDGLFQDARILVWGGVKFSLTTNQAIVFRLLVDAYPGDVLHYTFEDKGIRVLRDSFRFKNAQGKNQNYPCWDLIVGGSVKDSKRLIDPSIVRSNPKKFSDPQHNPHDSPR